MPRPTTRADLLSQATTEYDRLIALVEALDPDRRDAEFPIEDRDRRVRDVVGHLHAWQEMMLRWYADGMAGRTPQMPAPGHTWRTTAQLNDEIWRSLQDSPLDVERDRLAATHDRLLEIVAAHSDDELFVRRRYPWTGSTSLGAYLVSATSSHYAWASTKLRRAVRAWATLDATS